MLTQAEIFYILPNSNGGKEGGERERGKEEGGGGGGEERERGREGGREGRTNNITPKSAWLSSFLVRPTSLILPC